MPPSPLAVCLGDSCIDAYISPLDRRFVGGNAINVAVAIHQAGFPCAYAGFVGSDTWGQAVLDSLAVREIDCSHVGVRPGPTRQVYTRLSPDGQPQFLHDRIAPRDPFLPAEDLLAWVRGQRLAHLNWLNDPEISLDGLAGSEGLLISMDYGDRLPEEAILRTLPRVQIAFFARPAVQAAEARDYALRMQAAGPQMVVVTLGTAGSLAITPEGVFNQPAVPASVIDTLGAGDAFIGSFLAGHLLGKPVLACLEAAAQAAANTCTFHGGWPGAEILLEG